MQKTGVFVCWCGSNIAATVDTEMVTDYLKREPGVVFSSSYQYMCSETGQKKIINAIKENNLTGVVVCACSPRMHEITFRKALKSAGLNPYMLEVANIREHCSWIHKDKKEATEKAIVLGRAAIAKLNLNTPLVPKENKVIKRALVVGGGIAGMQTALDIAQAGYEVDIVEKKSTIGGKMAQIDKTFPTLDCAACILTPKMVDVASHEKIRMFTCSEVESVSGFVGDFKVKIRKRARSIKENICSGCGICVEKCPVNIGNDDFNCNLSKRKAVNIPFAQAVPNVPEIDRNLCLKFRTGKCGLCAKVCPADAIDFDQEDEIIESVYGAVVLATGFDTLIPNKFEEFGYNSSPDVITSLELERLMNAAGPTGGKLKCPSDGRYPENIVFIQCVGSRDTSERGKPYCSKICCMYTAKHAMLIREKYPDTKVSVFYIDVRAPGKNFDEFYRRATENYNVDYIKGTVGKIYPEGGKLTVAGSDLLGNEQVEIKADMVVLATAVKPDESAKKTASVFTASIDTNNFYTEAHPKLRPVESPTAGVFLSGVCQGPKDIPETVSQASAAAAKVIGLLSKDSLLSDPCVSMADENMCNGCGSCQHVCPYKAITYEEKPGQDIKTALVNEAICQGCGACTVVCPAGAMDVKGFTNSQIIAEVDAICR